jgi:hypothetical protein
VKVCAFLCPPWQRERPPGKAGLLLGHEELREERRIFYAPHSPEVEIRQRSPLATE